MPYTAGRSISPQLLANSAGQASGTIAKSFGDIMQDWTKRQDEEKQAMAAVKGTAQFLKTNGKLLGINENTIAELTDDKPNQTAVQKHIKMGSFLKNLMAGKEIEKADAAIKESTAQADHANIQRDQLVRMATDVDKTTKILSSQEISPFLSSDPDKAERLAIQAGAPPELVRRYLGPAQERKSRENIAEGRQNGKPPMVFQSLDALEAKFPAKQYEYNMEVDPATGQVTVPKVSPRAPVQPLPEVPNPLVEKIFVDFATERTSSVLPALKSLSALDEIGKIIGTDNEDFISGSLANPELHLKRLANAMGAKYTDVQNTQVIQAKFAEPVALIIKNFGAGTGLSDADREYALKAAGGDITLDAQAIRRLVKMAREASDNIRTQYQERLDNTFPENTTNEQYKMARNALRVPSRKLSADEMYQKATSKKKPKEN